MITKCGGEDDPSVCHNGKAKVYLLWPSIFREGRRLRVVWSESRVGRGSCRAKIVQSEGYVEQGSCRVRAT